MVSHHGDEHRAAGRGVRSVRTGAEHLDVVHRLCEVVADWPRGFELDLNPVTALPRGQGVRVLDAAYIAPKETT